MLWNGYSTDPHDQSGEDRQSRAELDPPVACWYPWQPLLSMLSGIAQTILLHLFWDCPHCWGAEGAVVHVLNSHWMSWGWHTGEMLQRNIYILPSAFWHQWQWTDIPEGDALKQFGLVEGGRGEMRWSSKFFPTQTTYDSKDKFSVTDSSCQKVPTKWKVSPEPPQRRMSSWQYFDPWAGRQQSLKKWDVEIFLCRQ